MKCKVCDCIEETHIYYWECPLINDYICVDCCWNIGNKEKYELFQEKLNELKISNELIREVCRKCGKNEFG
ncbi:MAG: hypothetical protein QXY18_07080 [Nitrososphaerota archaeon]